MADPGANRGKFPSLLILLQGLLLILFVVFVDYDSEILPGSKHPEIVESKYPDFQDVHTLVVVGFGLLMIFLKKYSFSALGYTFLIAAVTMQWGTIMQGFVSMKNNKIYLDLNSLITGDLTALTVIITFGAILGKTSSLQLLVMAFFEVIFYIANRNICSRYLLAVDPGGSMYIHLFGSLFGIMVAKMLYHKKAVAHDNEVSRHTSDMLATIGTLFLWVYWPSLNTILLDGTMRYRAIVNTYYALATSCVMAFGLSGLITKNSKLSMVHIQNATLVGGVAVGSVASMIIHPWGAILLGMAGGIVSTLGYRYFQPFLLKKLHLHDTCGISSLHGLPGIIAGIASAISSGLATHDHYKTSLYTVFPARAPVMNSTQYLEWVKVVPDAVGGLGRTAGHQAGFQIAALAVTFTIAIIGGLITGLIVKQSFFAPLKEDKLFYSDQDAWEVPEDFSPTHSINRCTQSHSTTDFQLIEQRRDDENEITLTATVNHVTPKQTHVHLETIA